jgi:hypothetical protein
LEAAKRLAALCGAELAKAREDFLKNPREADKRKTNIAQLELDKGKLDKEAQEVNEKIDRLKSK